MFQHGQHPQVLPPTRKQVLAAGLGTGGAVARLFKSTVGLFFCTAVMKNALYAY